MNAPALFVYFPFILGTFELLFAEKRRIIAVLSLACCAALIVLATAIPINSMIISGETSIIYISSTELLGRTLSIARSQQPIVTFLYAIAALGIVLSLAVPSSRFFVPWTLMSTALVVAVIAVSPFIFGAMMIFLIALIVFPILRYEQRENGDGLMRFLFWQLMGMIFLSLGAWLATLVGLNPTNQSLMLRVTLILFLGLIFWLGFFPIQTWLVQIIDQTCPFLSGFMVSLIQFASIYLLLNFMNSFVWIRTNAVFLAGLQGLGLVMLIFGGVKTLTQKSNQRIFPSVLIAENGIALILLGIRTTESLTVFLSLWFIRVVAGIIWSAASKSLLIAESARSRNVNGDTGYPLTILTIGLSYFSIVGFPFLAAFPLKVSFLSLAFALSNPIGAIAAFGMFLTISGGFRHIFRLTQFITPQTAESGDESSEPEADGSSPDHEARFLRIILILCCGFLISLMIYPDLLNAFITGVYAHFSLIVG